ncbi:MAG TPA: hypothetical protein VJX30_10395 [Terriglobales bacterium]|nr:hypothetical protein [Terriglobales bacterium]
MTEEEFHYTSASEAESVAPGAGRTAAIEALKDGPRGALIIAASAVGLLLLGWLFFYFVLFMSRGHVG